MDDDFLVTQFGAGVADVDLQRRPRRHVAPAQHVRFDQPIAIDDFGTGYSSLAYLTQLPVETANIDGSFIVAMFESPDAMTLVSTMISLALRSNSW